jgi:hypothetical protein
MGGGGATFRVVACWPVGLPRGDKFNDCVSGRTLATARRRGCAEAARQFQEQRRNIASRYERHVHGAQNSGISSRVPWLRRMRADVPHADRGGLRQRNQISASIWYLNARGKTALLHF